MDNQTPTPEDVQNEAEEFEDFDAWLLTEQAQRGGGKRIKIFGEMVTLPTDLPLGFTLRADETSNSSDLEDIQALVGVLYGGNALDRWIEKDIGLFAFQVLLAYGSAVASGKKMTLVEAAERVKQANAEQESGKGPKPRKKPKRRKGPGGGSPATGR